MVDVDSFSFFRIEHLWRDVYPQVLDLFHMLLFHLEVTGLLNPDDEIHLFALHWAFLPQLQHQTLLKKHGTCTGWEWINLRMAGKQRGCRWSGNRVFAHFKLKTQLIHHLLTLKLILCSTEHKGYSKDMLKNVCNQKALGHHWLVWKQT